MLKKYFTNQSFLHTVLRANGIFSGVFGLAFLLFPGTFSEWLGIPSVSGLMMAGGMLIVWEVFVFQLVRSEKVSPTLLWIVILGDLVWVLGSVGLLLGGWLPLTAAGKWFIAIVADIVLAFAILQFVGLRKQN